MTLIDLFPTLTAEKRKQTNSLYLGTDHYFFGGGGWKILKKIVCKHKKVQINCLHT